MDSTSVYQEVPIFWDLNTCPLQASSEKLVDNINKMLGQVHHQDPEKYLKCLLSGTKIACGDLSKLPKATQNCLKAQGFKLFDALVRDAYRPDHVQLKPYTPAPEFWLETHLLEYAIRHRDDTQKNILLVSGDCGFTKSLNILWESGYTIFLAMRQDSFEPFEECGNYTWYWEDMENGTGVLIRCTDEKY